MKKLMVMILLLTITLPAFAKEIRVTCDVDYGLAGHSVLIYGFNEAAGTVTVPNGDLQPVSLSIKHKNTRAENDNTNEYFINDGAFGYISYYHGEPREKVTISRIDGKWTELSLKHQSLDVPSGTCVRFKQAF